MSANLEERHYRPMIENKKCQQTNKTNQYLAGFAVSLSGFCAGTVLAWTSPALEFLLENDHHNTTTNDTITTTNHTSTAAPGFKITTSEEAFVGAVLMLGGLLSAIPSHKCADLFGRKITLIIIALLYLVNYIVLACASNAMMLVIGRFFAGLALGGCCVVSPMYIGETAEESLRGVLGSLFSVLLGFGVLYTSIMGIFSNWIGLNLALGAVPVAAAVAMLFIPDTPIYLVTAERFGKAKRSLMFFRGDEQVVTDELVLLQKNLAHREGGGTLRDLFTQTRYRRALIAGLGVFMYQQLCGINVVVFYLMPIFKAAGSAVNPMLAATTTNFVTLAAGIVSVFVIEKRNRKYFLMLSAVSMLIGITGLGVFFQLQQHNISFAGLKLLPISCVVLFMAGFAIGLGPVPWILLIELYTPEIRGSASGVIIIINWLSAFCVTLSYPYLMQFIGSTWTFYLYGLFNVFGILFIWFVVPETRARNAVRKNCDTEINN